MIYDHMIYMTQGHVTFEPGEPTGGMARRARISSQVSQQEGWLDELAFRAKRANRCDGLKSSKHHPLYKQRRFPYGILVFNSCCDPDY